MNYLINLDRRPDRLEAATAELNKAGIEFKRWPAVDGSSLNESFQSGPGALGCKLSHVAVLKDALEHGYDEITVYEDDVCFVPDFQVKLAAFMSKVPEDWVGPTA